MPKTRLSLAPLLILLSVSGCSPTNVAMKVGMFVAGKVVNDADAENLGKKLIGQPPSAADAELGERNDTYEALNGSVIWISYPVKLDVLKQNQYFVEVRSGRITRIEKMEGASGEVDFARSTFDKTRVHGKSPAECQKILDAGPPELSVRSQKTGKLMQFYNGKKIVDVGDKRYIILRFDQNQKCEKLQIVDVAAKAG
jgi:hypothetical protein